MGRYSPTMLIRRLFFNFVNDDISVFLLAAKNDELRMGRLWGQVFYNEKY